MRLVLWRHGRTDFNVQGRVQGWLDEPLNAEGRASVATAAAGLAAALAEGTGRIISSDLQRAHDTAHLLAQHLGVDVVADERLRERHLGEWEGELVSSFSREQWARLSTDPTFAPPGGETNVTVAQRMRAVVDELDQDTDWTVLVSHGGAVRILAADLLGIPEERLRKLDNAHWGELVETSHSWRLERWNQ